MLKDKMTSSLAEVDLNLATIFVDRVFPLGLHMRLEHAHTRDTNWQTAHLHTKKNERARLATPRFFTYIFMVLLCSLKKTLVRSRCGRVFQATAKLMRSLNQQALHIWLA